MTEETTEATQEIDIDKYTATLESNKSMLSQIEQLTGELDKFKAKQEAADKERKKAEKLAREEADNAARKTGDIEALEKSWNEKYSNLENSTTSTIEELNRIIQNVTVGAEAKSIASELAIDGSAGVLIPHIQSRLAMELSDGTPVIRVLQNGKPSALTLDDLKSEISENKAFAPLIKGTGANGSGDIGGSEKGGNTMRRGSFESLSHTEKSRFIKEGGKVID